MSNRKVKEEIDFHYEKAREIALKEIERMARDILVKHTNLHEFQMCMGSHFFTRRTKKEWQDSDIIQSYEEPAYMKPLNDFIQEYDHYLKLTGEAIRFTATSKATDDWKAVLE